MRLRVNSKLSLHDQLKIAREASDLTQDELASKLGVSARTVQNWEAGKTPRPKHRRAIKDFIGQAEAA